MREGSAAHLPPLPLRPYIERYLGVNTRNQPTGSPHTAIPSRHAHLIIGLNRNIQVIGTPDGKQKPASFAALVCGLQDAPAIMSHDEFIEGIHLFLTPLGVRSLLGIPCAELAGQVADLSDLWGQPAASLVQRLKSSSSWAERFVTLDDALLHKLRPVPPLAEVAWAWRNLLRLDGNLRIQQLAHELGRSRRHLGEQFRKELGITPKTAARIFRFEHACKLMLVHKSLAEVAALSGYADQAHMTHEWRIFTGLAPSSWIKHELPFLQDHELEDG